MGVGCQHSYGGRRAPHSGGIVAERSCVLRRDSQSEHGELRDPRAGRQSRHRAAMVHQQRGGYDVCCGGSRETRPAIGTPLVSCTTLTRHEPSPEGTSTLTRHEPSPEGTSTLPTVVTSTALIRLQFARSSGGRKNTRSQPSSRRSLSR